jgi:vancomycin resistance protein VanW
MNIVRKPKYRSSLRIYLGIRYYRAHRHVQWIFGRAKFARCREGVQLPFRAASHQSPLLRKLKDVDMWLQHNKIHNLKLAARRLDGVVLRPGETFSYWRLIGKPSRWKGYVDGMILSHGRVTHGVGGGLCQMSNLIYWMTLHTPLTVTERYRHGYDVFPDSGRSQPFGSGATCYYNYVDLQIVNRTDQTYQLRVALTDTDLQGEWRADAPPVYNYEIYERQHSITAEYWGGYVRRNVICRRTYNREGERIADEIVAENQAVMMYEPLLEEPAAGTGERTS